VNPRFFERQKRGEINASFLEQSLKKRGRGGAFRFSGHQADLRKERKKMSRLKQMGSKRKEEVFSQKVYKERKGILGKCPSGDIRNGNKLQRAKGRLKVAFEGPIGAMA